MRLLTLVAVLAAVALSVPLAQAQTATSLRGTVLCAAIYEHPLSKRTYESGFVATGLGVMVFYVDYKYDQHPTSPGSRVRLQGRWQPSLLGGRYFSAETTTLFSGLDREIAVRNVAVAGVRTDHFAFGTVDRYGAAGSDCSANYSARQKPAITRAAKLVNDRFQKRTLALRVVSGQLRLVAIAWPN